MINLIKIKKKKTWYGKLLHGIKIDQKKTFVMYVNTQVPKVPTLL